METEKFFAIVKGEKTGVFKDTWSNIQKYVFKFPDAQYKSFKTKEEADEYFDDPEAFKNKFNKAINEEIANLGDKDVIAFTDGSYKEGIDRYGSGAIIITKNNDDLTISEYDNNEKYLGMRNVSGEILAVKYVIEWAIERNYDNLHIFYDYQELEDWVDKDDSKNNDLSRNLYDTVKAAREKINITFSKVKSHTGVEYNVKADKAAKAALEK